MVKAIFRWLCSVMFKNDGRGVRKSFLCCGMRVKRALGGVFTDPARQISQRPPSTAAQSLPRNLTETRRANLVQITNHVTRSVP